MHRTLAYGGISLILGTQMCLGESSRFSTPHHNCSLYVQRYEQRHHIPTGLLHAISKVESGRKTDAGKIVPWPWTINVRGVGYYFPTKEEAIAAVEKFQSKGIESIDVGCMQVNLYHHPHAFQSLAQAFDPEENVAYAASFLLKLKDNHASWHKAVAHYHSANPVHHQPYQKAVFLVWDQQNEAEFQEAGWKENLSPWRSYRRQRLPIVCKASFKSKQPTDAPRPVKRVSRRGFKTLAT